MIIQPPSPHYDRFWKRRLLTFLKGCSESAGNIHPTVINVGSGDKNVYSFVEVINLDIYPKKDIDIVGDGLKLPFLDNSIDGVIAEAFIEHIKDPSKFVKEASRVLKKDGLILVSVPFMQGYHPNPYDCQRYTKDGLEELFKEKFETQEIGIGGGPSSALAMFFKEYFSILFSLVFRKNLIIYKGLRVISGWLTFWIKYLDYLLVRHPEAVRISDAFYYIGRKNG